MEPLHNGPDVNVPKAEPRGLLCSNKDVNRGSALALGSQEIEAEALVSQLAELIVEVYFYEQGSKKERE
ncbi:hypothetical protein SAMN05216464_104382 [Mucilaginibacter pineti]|uniref:Uncharacterized protein n=1 Tax=Mucilaginibacter pineti TaxID=1391627 RepID=A0A1G7B3J2_9SPHI|nr:hypothetical protein [Mucilaginibacter pineti]SDE21480.1 hypothetical protein SAMN05216464_104382 [Mucilaginibacter pineti]